MKRSAVVKGTIILLGSMLAISTTTATAGIDSSQQMDCAAPFTGSWVGTWSSNIGTSYLWVSGETLPTETGKCQVRIAYLNNNRVPKPDDAVWKLVSINNGVLKFICAPSTGGECQFTKGWWDDDLWASYSNPAGQKNRAIFEKRVIR